MNKLYYIGAASSVEVGVENPSGGVSLIRQTLSIVNPAPIGGGLSIAQITAGASSPLVISGTGYYDGSQVYFDGQLKSSTFSNGNLTINLVGSDIPTARTYSVVVTNPAPGGGSTQPMTMQVLNPTPSINAFSPSPLGLGEDVTLTLSGGGSFVSGAVAILYPSGTELTTTFVNTNTLTVSVPGSLLATVSETNYSIRVRNPTPGGGLSAPVTVPVRNAAPSFSGVSPNTLVAAAQDTPLTLTGGNFLSGATVLISGPGLGLNTPLTTTVVNANTITATLPAGIAASIGQYSLIVRNPNSIADSPAQNINIVYPQAQLSSVAPSPIPAQNAAQTLTLSGTNFVSGAQVRIQDEATNGQTVNQLLSASVINATQINATLPQTLAERVGRYRLTVDNPSPNAGVSGTVNVDVLALTPTFAALSTTSATMTGVAQTLTLTGTNFVNSAQNGTIVEVNGQPVTANIQSATQISLTLPVGSPLNLLDSARVLTIRIVNPALTINGTPQGGGASTTRTFTLLHPAPALSGFAPQVVTANPVSPTPVAFTLTGTNFTALSRVLVQRTGMATVDTLQATPNNLVGGLATSLALTLPAPLFTDATTFTLRVLTPYGSIPAGFVSGGVSAPQTLTVQNPLPNITTLTPAQSLILQTTTVTIAGTNFVQPSAINNNRGSVAYLGATALPTSVLSPTSIQVTIASALLALAQNYSITVQNPLVNGLGGGTSNAPTFSALNPTATLDSIVVPYGSLPLVVSSATQTLSIYGQFFVNGASVTFSRTGGAAVAPQTLTATFVSPNQLSISVPTAFLAETGTLTVQVANPLPTGGASNTLSAAIVNPRPRLLVLTPTTATISAADLALTLDGTNFLPNSTIFARGTTQQGADTTMSLAPIGYTPANATPTRLTASVPTTFAALAGTYFVWVRNPIPTVSAGGVSDTLSFFLRNPLPTLTLVTPAIVATGSGDTTFTLTGANFTPLASVLLNGTTLAASRVVIQDRTTILATIPAAQMTTATTLNVQVTIPAPSGGTSVIRTLTVRNAAPVLDSIAPATIAAMRDTVITAYGSGFNLTSQLRLIRGATTVTLAIVSLPSSGVARLAISSSAIVTLATYQVRVFNSAPGGGTSVARNLVVQGGVPVACEFVNLSTTAVVSGANLPAFTIRFRDEFGNLSDAPAATVNFGESTGASSGTLTLTRASAGVYTAGAKRFYEAGIYSLWIDGFSTTTGTRTFTVTGGNDSRVTFSGVPTNIDAGTILPAFTFQLEDVSGNLTDNGVGRLTYTRVGGSSTATLTITRLSTGIYAVQSTVCTIAGTYNLALSSVTAVNTLGTKSFLVVSGAAVRANFTSVTLSMNAGTQQSAFDVRFYDQYGNYTDNAVPTSVLYSNATTATGSVSTGTITFAGRTGIGLYDAARVTLTMVGNYELTTSGLLNTGNRLFVVKSGAARTVEFSDVPDTLWTAQPLPPVIVRFRDVYGNLTNDSRPITFTKTGTPASTGTVALSLIRTGVYLSAAQQFYTLGSYTLSISGISAANSLGNRQFLLRNPAYPTAPHISTVLPNTLALGSNPATVSIAGVNFTATSRVLVNNIPIATTVVSNLELRAVVPINFLDTKQILSFTVENPTPSSILSNTQSVSVEEGFHLYDTVYAFTDEPVTLTALQQSQLSTILQDTAIVRYRVAHIPSYKDVLFNQNVALNLFPDVQIQGAREELKRYSPTDYLWSGKLQDSSTVAIISTDQQHINASFRYDNSIYQIVPLSDGIHVIAELDPLKTAKDGGCATLTSEEPSVVNSFPVSCDGSVVKVLFVHTQKIDQLLKNGGIDKGRYYASVLNAFNKLEEVAKNSQLPGRFELAAPEPITSPDLYLLPGGTIDDYVRVSLPEKIPTESGELGAGRGFQNLRKLRDSYNADVVVIIALPGNDELTYALGSSSAISIPQKDNGQLYAYCTVYYQALQPLDRNYPEVLAHEIGHLFGGRHDMNAELSKEKCSDTIPDDYHGSQFLIDGSKSRNIMVAKECGTGDIIPFYGEPNIFYKGVPTGTLPGKAPGLIIKQNFPAIAAFRQSFSIEISGPKKLAIGQTGIWTITVRNCPTPIVNPQIAINSSRSAKGYSSTPITEDGNGGFWFQISTTLEAEDQFLDVVAYFSKWIETFDGAGQWEVINYGFANLRIDCSDCPHTSANFLVANLPNNFNQIAHLEQNSPNPVTSQTDISYTLTSDTFVSLSVHDAMGNEIGRLVHEFQRKGKYVVPFDAQNLYTGAYSCRLQTNHHVQTKQMLIFK